jgi:hypothetical protein
VRLGDRPILALQSSHPLPSILYFSYPRISVLPEVKNLVATLGTISTSMPTGPNAYEIKILLFEVAY